MSSPELSSNPFRLEQAYNATTQGADEAEVGVPPSRTTERVCRCAGAVFIVLGITLAFGSLIVPEMLPITTLLESTKHKIQFFGLLGGGAIAIGGFLARIDSQRWCNSHPANNDFIMTA